MIIVTIVVKDVEIDTLAKLVVDLQQQLDKTIWQDVAPPLKKDEPMPRTEEYYKQVQLRDQELILEMKAEISKHLATINKLRMKLKCQI